MHHQRLTIHRQIVQVVGELFGKRLHLGYNGFAVTDPRIDLTLGCRQPLVLSINLLQTVQYIDRTGIVLNLLIQLEQHLQQVLMFLVALIDPLNDGYRTGVVLLTDIGLCQGFHIRLVLRSEGCGTLHARQRLICILHQRIILTQEIIDFWCIGIDLLTMAQQVEGSIVMSFLTLYHRLHEELVIGTLTDIISQTSDAEKHQQTQYHRLPYHFTPVCP